MGDNGVCAIANKANIVSTQKLNNIQQNKHMCILLY